MTEYAPLRAALFDLDGTLVDSRLDFDAMRRDMGLAEGRPILEALANVDDGPEKARMLAVLREHELDGARRATLMPGAARLLAQLREWGWPVGIVTRNSRESTALVLERLRLEFSAVITRDDAPHKPDPAGLLLAASSWRLQPAEVVYCGDYLFDLEAGRRAGMRTILYWPGPEQPHYAGLADCVIAHFDEAAAVLRQWQRAPGGARR